MLKKQLMLQKIVIYGSFIFAAIMVFYALGYSTNLYNLSYHADTSSALFYVAGSEVYREAQSFNRQLFSNTVLMFVLCVAMFVTLTHRRRLYYISNYITSLVYAAYSAYLGTVVFQFSVIYKEKYLLVDFEKLREVKEMMKMRYSQSTFMLDLGMVFGVMLIVLALLIIMNLILKTIWMNKEKQGEVV